MGLLQAEGLATDVSSGQEIAKEFCMFSVKIQLTVAGEANVSLVLRRVYEYIAVVAAAGVGDAASAVWSEVADLSAIRFRYAERADSTAESTFWAKRLRKYNAEQVLSGGRVLSAELPAEQVPACLEKMVHVHVHVHLHWFMGAMGSCHVMWSWCTEQVLACLEKMVPSNAIVIRESKAFSDIEANLPAEDDEGDSACIVSPLQVLPPGAQKLTDPYYSIEYERRPIDDVAMAELEAARRGERAGRLGSASESPPQMHLPVANEYLVGDFSMVRRAKKLSSKADEEAALTTPPEKILLPPATKQPTLNAHCSTASRFERTAERATIALGRGSLTMPMATSYR